MFNYSTVIISQLLFYESIIDHKFNQLFSVHCIIKLMKDFGEIITEPDSKSEKKDHFMKHIDDSKHLQTNYDLQYIKNKAIKYVSPFLIAIVTAPFNTASMLLQISNKPISDPLSHKIKLLGNTQSQISSWVKLGIFGDNKFYTSAEYRNYNDCLRQMGKQGFKGLYKGAFIGVLLSLSNAKLRTYFYEQTINFIQNTDEWKTNLFTILTCTLADMITMPLMLCQSRFVFQNSLNNFRTYKTPFSILKNVPAKLLWTGSSILILKNIIFTFSWLSFFKESPVYSFIFSTVLSHLTIYPFLTVLRQLQCNNIGVPMMHQRQQKVREAIQRIWKTHNIKGFYRGFFGYSLVHIFLGIIVIENNVRRGYFDQLKE